MGEVRGRPAACPGPFNPPERHRTMSSSERDYLSGRRRHCINPQEKEGRRLESAREESGGRMASTFIPSGINLYMYRAGVLGRLSRCVIFIQWRERERARGRVFPATTRSQLGSFCRAQIAPCTRGFRWTRFDDCWLNTINCLLYSSSCLPTQHCFTSDTKLADEKSDGEFCYIAFLRFIFYSLQSFFFYYLCLVRARLTCQCSAGDFVSGKRDSTDSISSRRTFLFFLSLCGMSFSFLLLSSGFSFSFPVHPSCGQRPRKNAADNNMIINGIFFSSDFFFCFAVILPCRRRMSIAARRGGSKKKKQKKKKNKEKGSRPLPAELSIELRGTYRCAFLSAESISCCHESPHSFIAGPFRQVTGPFLTLAFCYVASFSIDIPLLEITTY